MEKKNIGRVLVIHPEDKSTAYLSKIYEGKGWDVMTDGKIEEIRSAIMEHDTIIMLGHGTPSGLLDMKNNRYIITRGDAKTLRDKNLVGIWCNADCYFREHKLKGFYTGMVISEVGEAGIFQFEITEEENDRQFREFCEAVRVAVDNELGNPEGMKDIILEEYKDGKDMSVDLKLVYRFNRSKMLPKEPTLFYSNIII